jgi:ribosomal RNA-processing protein 36
MKRGRKEYPSETDEDSEIEEVGVKYKMDGQRKNQKLAARQWKDEEDQEFNDSQDSEELDDSQDDDGSSSDDEDDYGNNPNSVQDIPLGQLIAIKQDGSTMGPEMRARANKLSKVKQTSFKREHKHRPVEMSSKKPVPVLREAFQGGKHRGKDPRFDPLSARVSGASRTIGDTSDDRAKKRYAFLYDEKLPQEKRELQEALKKTKSESKKAEIKAQLAQLTQHTKAEVLRRKKESAEKEQRDKRSQARAAGKTPYYLKKSEKKRQEILAKYEELKTTGGLDRFMEKRRKKNAAKDHRYLPSRRPDGGEY